MDQEKILCSTMAIRTVVDEYRAGWSNLRAKNILDKELANLRFSTTVPYLLANIASLSSWLDILYSARKHERYGGIDIVKDFVMQDLSCVEGFITANCVKS